MKWLLVISVLSAITGIWILCGPGLEISPLYVNISLLAWLISAVTAAIAFIAWCRSAMTAAITLILGRPTPSNPKSRSGIPWIGLFAGLGLTMLTCLYVITSRNLKASFISAHSLQNLIGIRLAIDSYIEQYHQYPPALQDVFSELKAQERFFISPCDNNSPEKLTDSDRLLYSSYVYKPEQGTPERTPDLIIAYERYSMCVAGFGVIATPVRNVLFGDGRVESLTEEDFADALRKDESIRHLRYQFLTVPAN